MCFGLTAWIEELNVDKTSNKIILTMIRSEKSRMLKKKVTNATKTMTIDWAKMVIIWCPGCLLKTTLTTAILWLLGDDVISKFSSIIS